MANVLTGNGKMKDRGAMAPNYDDKYDAIGKRIVKELTRDDGARINTKSPIEVSIAAKLIETGLAKIEAEIGHLQLIVPAKKRGREPPIGVEKWKEKYTPRQLKTFVTG